MKWIYFFGEGRADGRGHQKDLLGGKGAGLAEMSRCGVPVPPGFTIPTEACRHYHRHGGKLPPGLEEQFRKAMKWLEKVTGKGFGDPENPLLVSVRSGAKFSMPGMMDTILNLGLNDRTVEGLARRSNNPRFAWDSYRRFIQMFGNVVAGVEKSEFERIVEERKTRRAVRQDTELTAEDWKDIVGRFRRLYREKTGEEFPQDPWEQIARSRDAVFRSWNNLRAVEYRRLNKIPDDLGTAVNVQAMVFGNLGEDSATGVGFTRDPSSGGKVFFGEYLVNAQGEDVVAGIRTPEPISRLKDRMPSVYRQLRSIARRLERHYRDMQDFEFTVEKGKLFMLQTRTGKRTALAALRIAVDMVKEKLISRAEALLRVDPAGLDQLLRPVFDPKERPRFAILARGLPAGPGAAAGRLVFSAERAVEEAKKGPVILARPETNPDDISGMAAAQGILTSVGGMTSHASVVGRGMGKVCVVGCSDFQIDESAGTARVNSRTLKEGDWISLDGFTGEVLADAVPTVPSEILRVVQGEMDPKDSETYRYFSTLLGWADEERRLGVRANADLPADAALARRLGAEGIGLCRTEHMFFGEERVPKMLAMILAETPQERRKALEELFPFQKEDFVGIFREMRGLPVTIRLLDPPLHEFLPKNRQEAEKRARALGVPAEKILAKARELAEQNPMLGHRGCRLGITYPEITAMQARAILAAALELKKEGLRVIPEIMVPLVGHDRELEDQKRAIDEAARALFREHGDGVSYLVGTMIEVPRAAVTAGEIARIAEFFSFGTNDLTQMALGYSRDDYGKFIGAYLQRKIWAEDPFQTLDAQGVGRLIRLAVAEGRAARKNLKVGICGEHGGDPASVRFCHEAGLDYVSASPYRVPVARLASAQAAILSKSRKTRGGYESQK